MWYYLKPNTNTPLPRQNLVGNKPGQTIIEVLIATAVVALVMTSVVAGLALSVRNTSQTRFRSLAAKLSQDVVEVFRRERDRNGWETFYESVAALGDGRFCINTLPNNLADFSNLDAGECETSFALVGTDFTREIVISTAAEEIRVVVEVAWQDGDIVRIASQEQEFRDISRN